MITLLYCTPVTYLLLHGDLWRFIDSIKGGNDGMKGGAGLGADIVVYGKPDTLKEGKVSPHVAGHRICVD
jgi:hypothetical protein